MSTSETPDHIRAGGSGTTATKSENSITADRDIAVDLRRRRAESWRLPPLACGRRDPLDPLPASEPSTFGLTEDELRRHANELHRQGWGLHEIRARLAIAPRTSCDCGVV